MLGASKDVSHLRRSDFLLFVYLALTGWANFARLRRSVWQAIDQPWRYVKECRWAKLELVRIEPGQDFRRSGPNTRHTEMPRMVLMLSGQCGFGISCGGRRRNCGGKLFGLAFMLGFALRENLGG
jgi:hypothetical protein